MFTAVHIFFAKLTVSLIEIKSMSEFSFKARSHILSLLGDELIGSDSLAIFELVKNAYDADAEEVMITLMDLNSPKQKIIIEDDGCGMTPEILQNVWLEIGTDYKRGSKRKPSLKFNRISLGEKGVGRLAIHKLGKHILLETQTDGRSFSNRISLNWKKLIDESEYIQDAKVNIETIEEKLLPKGHGTRIIISDLKNRNWTRRELRDLARKINSIKSPFHDINKFEVNLSANDMHQEWFDDIKSMDALLKDSLYHFDFCITKSSDSEFVAFDKTYSFTPPKSLAGAIQKKAQKVGLEQTMHQNTLLINPKDSEEGLFPKEQKHLKNSDLEGIGSIRGRFHVYNLLSTILKSLGQPNVIKQFVKDNSGIKIFRDGIRVYNYGEANDDWLGLDLARVQRLGQHFSKNTVVGAIEIELNDSQSGLKEKTNREGFDDNDTFKKFRFICTEIFEYFENIAMEDRIALKDILDESKPVKNIGLSETITELEEKLKEKNLDKELKPLLKRVEKDYNNMRDVMLGSGMSGLNLGIVFHEVDREVKFINSELINNADINSIKTRVKHLIQLLENFSPLLKQNKNVQLKASQLVERASQISSGRFKHHNVVFSSSLLSGEAPDFEFRGPGNLFISALSNIIDNAIYWVSNKRELETTDFIPAICITTDIENFSGPAIVIADNGNGFTMDPEDLILPYRTTRPGGMGLGLYFTNMVMEMIGGKLLFPDRGELTISNAYTGAIIAMVFSGEK